MKHNLFLRSIALLLCLFTLLGVLAACGDNDGKDDGTTTKQNAPGGDNQTPGEPENIYGIPDSVDYKEQTVKVLAWKDGKNLFPEQMVEGESFDNDVYLRDREIEDFLGIKFDITKKHSHMNSSNTDGTELYKMAQDSEEQFDVICCYSLFPSYMVLDGLLTDLNAQTYPNTEMPWYADDIQEWSIRDRLFFVANNSSICNILATHVIFANARRINGKGLENIEEVVISGRWTLEKMKEYSRHWESEALNNIEVDYPTEDVVGLETNVYGTFWCHRTDVDAFFYGAGLKASRRDADGEPTFAYFNKTDNEIIDGFVDEVLDLMKSPECYVGPYYNKEYTYLPLKNKLAVFYTGMLDRYIYLDADDTYSVIPYPKMEEGQSYASIQDSAFDTWCIPGNATDFELSGMVIDAISATDYHVIAPKFFDNDFKYRYSSSENGVKIFDLIRSSMVCDFLRMFMQKVGSPFGVLRNCIFKHYSEDPCLENTFVTNIGNSRITSMTKLSQLQEALDALEAKEQGS